MINANLFQKADLFFQCIDQPDAEDGRGNDLSGMGVKSNDHCFSINGGSFFLQFLNYLSVAHMNAIKGSDSNNSVPKSGQGLNIPMYLHKE